MIFASANFTVVSCFFITPSIITDPGDQTPSVVTRMQKETQTQMTRLLSPRCDNSACARSDLVCITATNDFNVHIRMTPLSTKAAPLPAPSGTGVNQTMTACHSCQPYKPISKELLHKLIRTPKSCNRLTQMHLTIQLNIPAP